MDETLNWFKSTYSANGQSCIECARLPGGGMAVRDSKNPGSAVLRFTSDDWQAFTAGVRAGELTRATP